MGKEQSQGIHTGTSKSIRKAMRRDYLASGDRFMKQRISGKTYVNSRKGTFTMKEVQ